MGDVKRTQCEMILQYMKDNGSITAVDAVWQFGCMRLAARIADLRDRGHDIRAEDEFSLNRYGQKVRHARYYLNE